MKKFKFIFLIIIGFMGNAYSDARDILAKGVINTLGKDAYLNIVHGAERVVGGAYNAAGGIKYEAGRAGDIFKAMFKNISEKFFRIVNNLAEKFKNSKPRIEGSGGRYPDDPDNDGNNGEDHYDDY